MRYLCERKSPFQKFQRCNHSDLQWSNNVWTFKHNMSTDFLVDIKAAIQLPPSVKFLQYGSLRKMEREIYMWSEYKCFQISFQICLDASRYWLVTSVSYLGWIESLQGKVNWKLTSFDEMFAFGKRSRHQISLFWEMWPQ